MGSPKWSSIIGNGNWDDGNSWSNGAKPVNGDLVGFGLWQPITPVASGHDDEQGVTVDNLDIQEEYVGHIGSTNSPLTISAGFNVVHRGGGVVFYSAGTAATKALFVDNPNANMVVEKNAAGQVSVFAIRSGSLFVSTGVVFVELIVAGGFCDVGFGSDTDHTANPITGYPHVSGGELVNRRKINNTIVVSGGLFHQVGDQQVNGMSIVGGSVRYASTGTIGGLWLLSGSFDSATDDPVLTIDQLFIMPGVTIDLGPSTTVTNTYDYRNHLPLE